MLEPSKSDYLAASVAVYGDSQEDGAETVSGLMDNGFPDNNTLLSDAAGFLAQEGISNWKPIAASYIPQDGMYAVAFLTSKKSIIISF